MAKCEMCGEWPYCQWKTDPNIICPDFHPKPMTNADRIRSMTDEELAEMLNHAQGDGYLVGIGQRRISAYGNWLEWLKRESEV